MICAACQMLFGRSDLGRWDGWDMWHTWESRDMCRGFWWGNQLEINLMGGSERSRMWECGLDSAGSCQWEVVSCEHGKEYFGLHKMQEIGFEW